MRTGLPRARHAQVKIGLTDATPVHLAVHATFCRLTDHATAPIIGTHMISAPRTRGTTSRDEEAPLDGYVVEEQVGFLLRRAHQRHVGIFQEGMRQVDLTPTQFTALVKVVELRRVTQNHLGRLAGMDPVTTQGVVRRLVARGLLRQLRDPADRRMIVLAPTTQAVTLIGQAVASARAITKATLAPLTAGDQAKFLSLLRKMI